MLFSYLFCFLNCSDRSNVFALSDLLMGHRRKQRTVTFVGHGKINVHVMWFGVNYIFFEINCIIVLKCPQYFGGFFVKKCSR